MRVCMTGEGQDSQEGRQDAGLPLAASVVLMALAQMLARCEHPARPPQPLHSGWRRDGTKPALSACCQLGISLCRGALAAP